MKHGDNLAEHRSVSLPNPRVSRKYKLTNKKWQKETIDYYISNRDRDYSKRKTPAEIQNNWDFYNTHLTEDETKLHLDPYNVADDLTDDEYSAFQFYNLLDNPFSTLIGEELKRKFDVKAYAINEEINNQKDKEFTKRAMEYFQSLVQQESVDEEEVAKKLKELDVFKVKDLQSAHEKMGNEILKSFKHDVNINAKHKFNTGFLNYQIANEQIYRVHNIGKHVAFKDVDSKKFHVIGLNSNFIADADAWIEEEYLSPYKVIAEFGNELSDSEVKEILEIANVSGDESISPKRAFLVEQGIWDVDNIPDSVYVKNSTISKKSGLTLMDYAEDDYVDANGNIRLFRVQFKTLRKIGLLTFLDKKTGKQRTKFVDEEYPVDAEAGETIEYIQINDIWEGVRIAGKFFKKVRPLPVQMRSVLNPAIVRPSYVGYVNFNYGGRGQSRIDKLKPFQRLYNVWMNKLINLWMDNIGKAAVVDTAKIPSDMDTDEWYLWLKRYKIMFENSFEEGKKGIAKGQLAGNMQQSSKTIDLSLAQDINEAVNMLNYIERKVNEISAIPEARQGNMTGNEGLGTSQQAVINSSSRTEHDFFIHDLIKSQTYEVMLEYAKWLWKDEELKLQYTTSDMSTYMLSVDGPLLAEAELGVAITNSSESFELSMLAKQMLHPAMQNGMINLSDALRLQLHGTPNEIIERLQEAENKKTEEQQKIEEQKAQYQQQAMETKEQSEIAKHERDKDMAQFQHDLKMLELELSNSQNIEAHSRDTNQNHIDDEVELMKVDKETESKEKLQTEKLRHEAELKDKELKSKEKIEAKKIAQVNQNAKKV